MHRLAENSTKDVLELLVLPLVGPHCWDKPSATTCLVYMMLRLEPRACYVHSTNQAIPQPIFDV